MLSAYPIVMTITIRTKSKTMTISRVKDIPSLLPVSLMDCTVSIELLIFAADCLSTASVIVGLISSVFVCLLFVSLPELLTVFGGMLLQLTVGVDPTLER